MSELDYTTITNQDWSAGTRIMENNCIPPDRPKIQLSPDFKWITDQKREEVNAWLEQRFGREPCVIVLGNMLAQARKAQERLFFESLEGPFSQPPTIMAHPLTIEMLREAMERIPEYLEGG